MANSLKLLLENCFSLCLILTLNLLYVSSDGERKLHIVYMGSLPKEEYSPSSHHLNLLQGVTQNSNAENLLVRSYNRSFNGFAAMLSDSEAKQLVSLNNVVSVFPSIFYQLHTTRSWSFMGFNETTQRNPSVESDLIIGVFDTGIWPESESFNDEGLGPPPKKWKGSCMGGVNFTCNNKLIGARYYYTFDPKANTSRDDDGHGTHTASTATGNKVKDTSFFGLASGVARGGVPSARIAAYKVCLHRKCASADVLAAFDDAIADGVDIVSISIGYPDLFDFASDAVAIGSFHALEKGIFTSQSAGNGGPNLGLVSSTAPWVLSVAAGSTDRRIIDKVIAGNGDTAIGNSINTFDLKGQIFPFINGTMAKLPNCSDDLAFVCFDYCLNSSLAKGKILLCDDPRGINEIIRVGGIGSVFRSQGTFEDVSFPVPIPSLLIKWQKFYALRDYIKFSKNATVQLLKSEAIKDFTAPIVASFSSRGPNQVAGDILKPDIVAPGVEILAAYPPNIPPTKNPIDKRSVKYSILSGTSMACPHAAGVAAYLKTFHPEWSPSAIKSAIMTTAIPMNSTASPGAEFAYGSGHINPLRALNPGLVYDTQIADYIIFLCGIGYNETRVRRITGDNSTTCSQSAKESPWNLNYPSLTAKVPANTSFAITFIRTVTNVGSPNSTYKAEVSTTLKLKVEVVPNVLSFNSIKEKKSFNVTAQGEGVANNEMVSASLVWSDGSHIVRSPIVVYNYTIGI